METYKTKAKVKNNHRIQIENVPFNDGETVEITIDKIKEDNTSAYPLRGTKYKYEDPFEPAFPPKDWEVLNDTD